MRALVACACALLAVPPAASAERGVVDDTPVAVAGLTDVVQLASSEYAPRTCARRANGHVACWGQRFGAREAIDATPVEVAGITDAIDVAVAVHDACARLRDKRVVCWGARDTSDRVLWKKPTVVPELANTTVLFAEATVCGVGAGVIACTGGMTSVFHAPEHAPTRVWNGSHGRPSWLCVEVDGHIACEQAFAERHGGGTSVAHEGDFGDLDGARDVALPSNSIDTTCVVRAAGTVECRAYGDRAGAYEQLAKLGDVVALRGGCALRGDGTVACWDDGTRKRDAIAQVAGIADAVELASGDVHHCVRRKSGRVACWGYVGLLGDGRKSVR